MKIMKMKTLFIISLVLGITSCKKDKVNESKTLTHGKISQDLYPYLFDANSYWVYKKINSTTLDSINVKSIKRDTLEIGPIVPGQGPQGDEEIYRISYVSSLTNTSFEEQLLGSVITRGEFSGGMIYISSKKVGDESSTVKIINVFDTLTVETKKYKNVVKVKVTKDVFIDKNYFLYYVDSIGIVKKEILTNDNVSETWNLLRSNIKLLKVN